MAVKMALGNVLRNVREYAAYFIALAFSACLLYSFLAAGDYVLGLDLTVAQRETYSRAGNVLSAFSVLVVVVFAFLVGYANAFLARRRKREFGLYALLGMGRGRVACILALECGMAAAAALVSGILLGVALSPVFGLVTAFVFGARWVPSVAFSGAAAIQTCISFAFIAAVAVACAAKGACMRDPATLFAAERVPEPRPFGSRGSLAAQVLAAVALLGVVWGTCLFQPLYFFVFAIPLGFVALFGTYFLFRVLAFRLPTRERARVDRYWRGLRAFSVRQVEARAESECMAAAAACVLIAAGMCMVVAGLMLSAGLRGSEFASDAVALAPVAFSALFYGMALLVAAVGVLSLRQLSWVADSRRSWGTLFRIGVSRDMARAAIYGQVGVGFAVPTLMAWVHCVFGFAVLGVISVLLGVEGFLAFAGASTVLSIAILAVCWAVTSAFAERALCR